MPLHPTPRIIKSKKVLILHSQGGVQELKILNDPRAAEDQCERMDEEYGSGFDYQGSGDHPDLHPVGHVFFFVFHRVQGVKG